jgi:hypothetical protein
MKKDLFFVNIKVISVWVIADYMEKEEATATTTTTSTTTTTTTKNLEKI